MKSLLPECDDADEIKTRLGLNEESFTIDPVAFNHLDPLGTDSVPKITTDGSAKSEGQTKYIGEQAMSLVSSLDRILALKNLTTSIHIMLSRSIVLNLLSLLSMSTNYVTLTNRLEMIGLSDIRKVVRLMTLTAMNRVEISNVQNFGDFPNLKLPSHFIQLSNLSPEASSCLNCLSISIAALAQNDVSSSNLVVNMCTNDLVMCALGFKAFKCGFAVTQALINILSTHGGNSLMDLPKEEVAGRCFSCRPSIPGVTE